MRHLLRVLCVSVTGLAACGEVLTLAEDGEEERPPTGLDGSSGGSDLEAGETPPLHEGGGDGGKSGGCGGACGANSTCVETSGHCEVTTANACKAAIGVSTTGGHFVGTICPDAGRVKVCGSHESEPAHVYWLADRGTDFRVELHSADGLGTNVVLPSCQVSAALGCNQFGAPTDTSTTVGSGELYAIGIGEASRCVKYDVTFTPK